MGLIVNSKSLPNNASKEHELYEYVREYQQCVTDLKAKFPTGNIALRRNGYPKVNRSADGSINLPEVPAPIFIKLTSKPDSNGAVWGYCKGRPLIHPNGLVDVPPNDNSEVIDSEVLNIPLRSKPDYAFYIMYKSGLLGSEYTVYDPEGDKLAELMEKNAKLKVQSLIRDTEEEKLRMLSQAWGISKAGTKNILLLQEELENKVFSMEEERKKNPTNLMLKGVAEFIAESKNDEVSRPKAIIQMGFDDGRITFNGSQSKLYFDDTELCYIPSDRQTDKLAFLAQVLRNPDNSEKWMKVLRGLLSKDYIEKMDKYGKRWLAGQLGVPLNKKEEDLVKALLEQF